MKFQIFKDGKVVTKFQLSGAYMFGSDGIAIRHRQIRFKGGFIECKKPIMETSGLALLWPVDGFGKIVLSTTCLSERVRPYNLNVEIARAKLMQIINKREDWFFFDGIGELENISQNAQDLFVKAIQNISDSPKASRLADESLKKSIVFSEQLAVKYARSLFNTRLERRGFGRGCLGCKIDPSQIDNSKYVENLIKLFGFVTIPINWAQIECEQGNYDFSVIDRCIGVLGKEKLAIGGGPLLCFTKEYLPKWLQVSGQDFEKIRESAHQFILKVVNRYSDSIHLWRVVSGLNMYNYFGFSFEQVLEMTRAANMAVKAADEKALKIVEVSNPWGEYYAIAPNTIPPWVYIDMVVQSGINFDAFGLQMRLGKGQAGMRVRDMMQISAALDGFLPIAKPVHITEVEVPSTESDSEDVLSAGLWHKKWDQRQQAKWIEQFYKIALSKSFVEAVTYSSLTDNDNSIIDSGGLITKKLEQKESFKTLQKLRDTIFNR